VKGDTGSATVLVIAAGALLSTLAVVVGLVATGLTAHRQAVRAADLAALAGAQRSLTDATVACTTAAAVAEANGSELNWCRLDGEALRVTVMVRSTGWLPAIGASARAGVPRG
jgi:secretion/DNA translocation related TadE-like protein